MTISADWDLKQQKNKKNHNLVTSTVLPANSDSGVIFCLQLLSKILTCTLNLSKQESIDQLCINPILQIGLIYTDLSIISP